MELSWETAACVEDTRRLMKQQTAEDWQRLSFATSPRLPWSDSLTTLDILVRRRILTPTSFLLHLGNRSLRNNQLIFLTVGVSVKNTRLTYMYVDKRKDLGSELRRGSSGKRQHAA
jgi:hypothetical protein